MSDNMDKIMKKLREEDISVNPLSVDPACMVNDWVSTGCMSLDSIMGNGLPVGRITEIYGGASTGKSLIAGQVAATAQQLGNLVLYVDTEGAVSISVLETLGVDTDRLMYTMPDTIEEVFKIFENAIVTFRENKEDGDDTVLVLIWDSIAATTAMAELEKEVGASHMGLHARLMSQALRKLTKTFTRDVCCLFINQTRKKIGLVFGDDEATFGGKAMEFYSSVRVRLGRPNEISGDKDPIGITTVAKVVKNKVAPPFREATLPIYFDFGIDDGEATFIFLKDYGLIEHTGRGWYVFRDDLEDLIGTDDEGEPKKFQRNGFLDIYEEHYDRISELVLSL